MPKKMILTSELHAEHQFAGQNTQQLYIQIVSDIKMVVIQIPTVYYIELSFCKFKLKLL